METPKLNVTAIESDQFLPFVHRQIHLFAKNAVLPGDAKHFCYADIPIRLAIPVGQ